LETELFSVEKGAFLNAKCVARPEEEPAVFTGPSEIPHLE